MSAHSTSDFIAQPQDDLSAQVRTAIAADFATESVTTPKAGEAKLKLLGEFSGESGAAFARISERLRTLDLMALAQREGQRVALYIVQALPKPRPSRWQVNLWLLLLTIASTLWVGSQYAGNCLGFLGFGSGVNLLRNPLRILDGAPLALGVLTILGVHELGHYFLARKYRIAVTLPYFIPVPFGIGTFGAVIRMKEPLTSRQSTFDIGIAGPLAGLVIALPLYIAGLYLSEVRACGALSYGHSLFTNFFVSLIHGPQAWGRNIVMHPLAQAGWIGLLVTSINLLPIGQLDGGHITSAIFGERWAFGLARATFTLMAVIALLYGGYLLWIGLIFMIGLRHPPPLNDVTPLDWRRCALGIATLLFSLLIFMPAPVRGVGWF